MGKPPGAARAGWLGKVLSPGVSRNMLGAEPGCKPRAARGGDWERRKKACRQEAKCLCCCRARMLMGNGKEMIKRS